MCNILQQMIVHLFKLSTSAVNPGTRKVHPWNQPFKASLHELYDNWMPSCVCVTLFEPAREFNVVIRGCITGLYHSGGGAQLL